MFSSILVYREAFKPFWVLRRKLSEQTAAINSETLETIESQTQPERLYEGVPHLAELKIQEAAVSELGVVETQPALYDGRDEDTSATGHQAKHVSFSLLVSLSLLAISARHSSHFQFDGLACLVSLKTPYAKAKRN